ncbi:MAG: GlsB/YeaQ/YmgE family stress response membrane protein, partial [bacterium]
LGYSGATGINLYSILVATLGAVVFLWIWKMVTARRAV